MARYVLRHYTEEEIKQMQKEKSDPANKQPGQYHWTVGSTKVRPEVMKKLREVLGDNQSTEPQQQETGRTVIRNMK